MIDNQQEVRELIQAMEECLPIQATIPPLLSESLRKQGTRVKANQAVQIESVLNLGDEAGIACCLGQFGTEVLIVSLTQLRVDREHPLADRIRAYQSRRLGRIDQPVDRSSRPSPAKAAKLLKLRRKSRGGSK